MSLGRRLRALRSETDLSLRQVATLAGVSPSTLSRAERDKGVIDTIPLSKLAAFYGQTFESLLDVYEPNNEEVDFFLIGLGYNLEKLRSEINALIDELQAEAKELLARKGTTS